MHSSCSAPLTALPFPSRSVARFRVQYALLPRQAATESAAYFVLEHQPSSCRQLPPNGNVTWTDIQVEVNGKPVDSPVFKAMQENPKCGSKADVVDAKTIDITWGNVYHGKVSALGERARK